MRQSLIKRDTVYTTSFPARARLFVLNRYEPTKAAQQLAQSPETNRSLNGGVYSADKLASGFTEFLEKVDDFHVIMLQT